ncbi:sensor histidine kinase [Kyrpidia spormannii]|uniref:Uncharacterized protein n=1 Tax=Kyrpidia spormannii TaxID=2055160 RepID=A0ACA8ZBB4_9BACL|nr:sensor histidine kinase [Kyrpidia spormannii]CAB3394273.1 conserved membrane protein of unknown function [Kyrpidia spormannii]
MKVQPILTLFVVVAAVMVAAGGLISLYKTDQATAFQGILDLSGRNTLEEGSVLLNGQWEFYWNQLLNPADFEPGHLSLVPAYIQVPRTWQGQRAKGVALSDQGFGTYRLVIRTPPENTGKPMGLYVRGVASAYKLWVNGQLLLEKGVVGTSRSDMRGEEYSRTVFFPLQGNRTELVMQVSNFIQRKGGLWEPISFGTADAISVERDRAIAFEAVLTGAFFVVAVYHFGLFLARRRERWALYFGALSFGIGVRVLTTGDTLLPRLLPEITWEFSVHLEYLSVCFAVTMLLSFARSQYPDETNSRLYRGFVALFAAYGLFVATTPAVVYTYTMVSFQLLVLAAIVYVVWIFTLAWRRKRPGSSLNMFATAAMLLFALNDVLYYNHMVGSGRLIQFGMLSYILIEAVSLARQFSSLFTKTERLATELQEINESLEEKVRERTRALRMANEELERANRDLTRMEAARRHLLSNISHELGTPLTMIRGYIKAVLDRIDETKNENFLQMTYDKTVLLERMIRDLLELSSLESGRVRFEFQQVKPLSFFRGLFEKYQFVIREGGAEFQWTFRGWGESGTDEISIDPMRMEQALANLLLNAKKYTPRDGRIEVIVRKALDGTTGDPALLVEVQDSGPGIAEGDLPFVFERFYRSGEARKTSPAGMGLGLGSTLTIALPLRAGLTKAGMTR